MMLNEIIHLENNLFRVKSFREGDYVRGRLSRDSVGQGPEKVRRSDELLQYIGLSGQGESIVKHLIK